MICVIPQHNLKPIRPNEASNASRGWSWLRIVLFPKKQYFGALEFPYSLTHKVT
jgi:hypothetical protein